MALFEPGRLVESRAGRDRGSIYLVQRLDSDGFIWVVDGERRPVGRPKKKNPKHLKAHAHTARQLGERWLKGEPVSDSEVQEVLRNLEKRHKEAG